METVKIVSKNDYKVVVREADGKEFSYARDTFDKLFICLDASTAVTRENLKEAFKEVDKIALEALPIFFMKKADMEKASEALLKYSIAVARILDCDLINGLKLLLSEYDRLLETLEKGLERMSSKKEGREFKHREPETAEEKVSKLDKNAVLMKEEQQKDIVKTLLEEVLEEILGEDQ